MLDVDPSGAGVDGFHDEDGGGDEMTKRVEKFGHPVGKGVCFSPFIVCHVLNLFTRGT